MSNTDKLRQMSIAPSSHVSPLDMQVELCAAAKEIDSLRARVAMLEGDRDEAVKERDELIDAVILGPLKGKTMHDALIDARAERDLLRTLLREATYTLDAVGQSDVAARIRKDAKGAP